MKMNKFFSLFIFVAFLPFIQACKESGQKLKVAATAVPHAEMLEFVKEDLLAKGVQLEILVMDDYNIPNRALAEKEVAANFFQHLPFLDAQKEAFHYPLKVLTQVHIEPMGVYSKNLKKLQDLKVGARIAVPSDPTNEARALALLHNEKIITLKDVKNLKATIADIIQNELKLNLVEVDAAMLPRTLDDVDAAVIPTNFALQANLSPEKDALIHEGSESPYGNILVVRENFADSKDGQSLKLLQEVMTSPKMRQHILEKYHGAILPLF